ncbi:MAG TPA: TM2 domain-containing protein [Gammaproteobacteria bacterium]|nr:TM2 domain-containing protein [Gammaproteobacteria bacterium]
MSDTWKKFDLEGAGLQTLNMRLARSLRKRAVAYSLWLLFPVGAHRRYLADRRGSLVYVALTALTLIVGIALSPPYWFIPAGLEVLFALFDLFWIDRRVVTVNKELRMNLYLGSAAAPPAGYRGRYTDEEPESLIRDYTLTKEREKAGHPPAPTDQAPKEPEAGKNTPSFAEQERMLRELARTRKRQSGDRGDDR